jgi:hypothetical protein
MKKIFILAGAILLFVLLLTAWIFIIDFNIFAENLSEGIKEGALDEKSRFIGSWETQYIEGDERFVGYNGMYIFSSDGSGSIGGLTCTWEISEGKLVIYYYEGITILSYDYSFSDDENKLSLSNTNGSLIFNKKLN